MDTDQKAKRPRLSLQIKNVAATGTRLSRTLAIVDPKSPTAFNTLSNVYVTAIERSTPIAADPLTAINTLQPLQVQTGNASSMHRIQTPFVATYPETPLTAQALSPMNMEMTFPSVMTATPPLSAGPIEPSGGKMFTFSTAEQAKLTLNTNVAAIAAPASNPTSNEPRTPRRSTTLPNARRGDPPYSHPRSLHSILRNSPLPPSSARLAVSPMSPRRQSARLAEKAARRVAYNSPLEQTIVTSRYTKSHIDLLCGDDSPCTPATAVTAADSPLTAGLDAALAFTSDETRDGGETPGPFEEMRRRMAGLGTKTPVSPSSPGGIRKRKRKDKKRRWVWTIGQEEDGGGDDASPGAAAALKAAEMAKVQAAAERKEAALPVPTIKLKTPVPGRGRRSAAAAAAAAAVTGMAPAGQAVAEEVRLLPTIRESPMPSIEEPMDVDVDMSDACSLVSDTRSTTPCDMDLRTPVAPYRRQDSVVSVVSAVAGTGNLRDTPVPPDLLVS